MTIEHRNITDAERHEPKGASTATVDQVYVSDGAASGSWKEVPFVINAVLDDVSTASSILIPIPFNLKIQSIRFTLGNAITVANASVSVVRSDAASLGATTIVFTGSAEGISFDSVPISNNVITASTQKYIKITTDGASTTASKLYISLKCKAV